MSSLAPVTATMIGRSLRLTRRTSDALLIGLMLPVLLMLLFVYLFGGAIDTGSAYVTYVVPGVIALCTGYGSSLTAVSVATDMTEGVIDRFRSMDVPGGSIIAGHVVASVTRNGVSTLLVLAVALLIGFEPTAETLDWLAAAGVLLMFVFAMSWFSAAAGLLAKSPEGAGGFTFLVLFLPYPSSAFVPIETMPSWLRGFAEHQPATPVIESLRALLTGTPAGDSPLLAVTWCAGILAVSIVAGELLFRRRYR